MSFSIHAIRGAGLAALLLLVGAALPAAAQDATVKVGNQTKKAIGTVTKLEAGDVACYVSLKDDQGVAFDELADFEVCEQKPSIKGKRVALSYALGKVMADSCQGDPGCKKTRTVAMVSSAKIIGVKSASGDASPRPAAAAGQTSFCTPNETVIFACRTGPKLVSVCASKDAGRGKGSLQYRFGKPDSPEPLEMTLPESMIPPAKAASGEAVPFAGGGGSWLRFRKGEYGYVVYSGIGKWGPKGETREKQGLVVERAGKQIASLKCSGRLISELGPDWFEKAGVQGNNQDFDFPD